jgi:hypothetical protein
VRVDTSGQGSRAQLQQADAVINEFRSALRSELRMSVAQGKELTAETVDALRAGLDGLKTSILGR